MGFYFYRSPYVEPGAPVTPVVTGNLIFHLDVQNPISYPEIQTKSIAFSSLWYDLTGSNTASLQNVDGFNSDNTGKRWLDFNGSNTLGIIPENSSFNTQTVSVEVWVRTNNLNQNGFFFEKGNVNTQYSLFQNANNTIYWRQILNGSISDLTINSSVLNTTEFKQIVGTFSSGNRKIYVNGVQVASDTAAGTISTNTNGVSIGVYGGFNGTRNYWYNGSIAVVRVYNKQLTAAEVLQNYNANRYRYELFNIVTGSTVFNTPSFTDSFDNWEGAAVESVILTGSTVFNTPSFTDTFDNWDGSAIESTILTGSATFSTPTFTDTFDNWDGSAIESTILTGSATFSTPTFTDTFDNWDGSAIESTILTGSTIFSAPTIFDSFEINDGWV